MKKVLLTLAFFSLAVGAQAQTDEAKSTESTDSGYNKWSVEIDGGFNKPFRTLTPGFHTETPGPYTIDLGARYMFNPKFGIKFNFGYNKFKDGDDSLPWESTFLTGSVEGVVNLGRVLSFDDWTKTFGLLVHGGPGYYNLTANQDGAPLDAADQGLNLRAGLTGQIKLSKSIVFTLDVTGTANFMQTTNWDGFGYDQRFVDGMMLAATGGFTFYLGSHDVHADWYYQDNKMQEQLDNLEKRVGDLETMLNDSDKDGIPDYLDAEPNTTTGVAVNSKGQAIDNNGNGVPDELESYLTKTYGDPGKWGNSNTNYVPNNELIRNLINEGYVTTYFDYNKSTPTNASSEGIDFILTYLRNNPKASVEIIGHADELGKTEYNDKLSTRRAEAVKAVLVKAKIDASRLKVVPAGEDRSVEASSDLARKLVRRVTFRVN